jgi:hypothetical protein
VRSFNKTFFLFHNPFYPFYLIVVLSFIMSFHDTDDESVMFQSNFDDDDRFEVPVDDAYDEEVERDLLYHRKKPKPSLVHGMTSSRNSRRGIHRSNGWWMWTWPRIRRTNIKQTHVFGFSPKPKSRLQRSIDAKRDCCVPDFHLFHSISRKN